MEIDKRDETIAILREALRFYADPGNYHAISFMFDRPCGGFADDFSKDHGDEFYRRRMPGALARRVLRESDSGVLSPVQCEAHGIPLRVEPQLFCDKCTEEALGDEEASSDPL
jgi:hypothetical protein